MQHLHQTDDPHCVIAEAGSHNIIAASGRACDQRYVLVFSDDGRRRGAGKEARHDQLCRLAGKAPA